MTQSLFFPDNTVLINFAHMAELQLLEKLLNGRGSWTITLSQEVAHSASHDGLGALSKVGEFLGVPIAPTPSERMDTTEIRKEFAAPGDSKTKHLGEAETFAVIHSRGDRHFVITDDGDAYRYAMRHNITVQTSCDMLAAAVRLGFISLEAAWQKLDYLFGMPRYITRAPRSKNQFASLCVPSTST